MIPQPPSPKRRKVVIGGMATVGAVISALALAYAAYGILLVGLMMVAVPLVMWMAGDEALGLTVGSTGPGRQRIIVQGGADMKVMMSGAGLDPAMEAALQEAMRNAKVGGGGTKTVSFTTYRTSSFKGSGVPKTFDFDERSSPGTTTFSFSSGGKTYTDPAQVPPEMAATILQLFIGQAESTDPAQRRAAAVTIGSLGRALTTPIQRAEATACLQVLASDSDASVKAAAVEAIAKFNAPAPAAPAPPPPPQAPAHYLTANIAPEDDKPPMG
jgi:hypothetical protein